MNIVLLTPDSELFRGQATSVKVPGASGQFEVLTGHASIVSSLSPGEVRIILTDGSRQSFKISGGFVEVFNNEVSVLASGVEL